MLPYLNWVETLFRGIIGYASKLLAALPGSTNLIIVVFMISAVTGLIIIPMRGRLFGGASDSVKKERK